MLSSPASVSWVIDLSTPAAPTNLAISPDDGPDPSDNDMSELTNSQIITFSGTVDANTVEVRLEDLTTSTSLGDAFLTGQSFSRALTLAPGLHELSAQAFDLAANGSSASTFYVFVDVAPPAISSMAPITPNPATTPVNTETVVLTKTVKTFDYTALSLTRNGSPVALNSSVTVAPVSGAAMPTYQISGLAPFTNATGAYVLTVDAGQVIDYASDTGAGTAAVSWNERQTTVETPTSVYVASSYASDPVDTPVTWTDGSTHTVGFDAFSTIQAGINSVAADGTVYVASGTYTEQLTIEKSLRMIGAGRPPPRSRPRRAPAATRSRSRAAPPPRCPA